MNKTKTPEPLELNISIMVIPYKCLENIWRDTKNTNAFLDEHPINASLVLVTAVAMGILSQSFLVTGLVGVGGFSVLGRDRILERLLSDLKWLKSPKSFRSLVHVKLIHLFSLFKRSTYSFEKQLPQQPVPGLKQTWDKYLASVKPLLTVEEFSNTQKLVGEFCEKEGRILQTTLEEYAKSKDNWVYELWENFAYLRNKKSLAFSTNWYGIDAILEREFEKEADKRLVRACHLIRAALEFKKFVDEETLSPTEGRTGIPLCMEQYKRLFACTRKPGEEVDVLKVFPHSTHIVVGVDGRFYKMDVYKNSVPLTDGELWQQLTKIQQLQQKNRNQAPDEVNILTSQDRRKWYKDRERLTRNQTNAASLKAIEEALLVLCLDSYSTKSNEELARNIFLKAQNRWFDKSLQYVVDLQGALGGNMEHSGSDATIVSSMYQYILYLEEGYGVRNGDKIFLPTPKTNENEAGIPDPVPLEWQLSDDQKGKIQKVKSEFEKQAKDYDLKILHYESYGKEFIKRQKLSPDAYIQMAIQLAYYKLTKKIDLTYETASTRLFLRGRTATIRTVSTESQAFVNAMSDVTKSNIERIRTLRSATEKHVATKIDAMSGHGIDRHILGLGIMAKQQQIPVLLYEDKSLKLEWKLATSQTPCERSLGGGFSPLEESGYGVSYTVYPDSFIFHITSKKSCEETDSTELMNAIRESLDEMSKLFSI